MKTDTQLKNDVIKGLEMDLGVGVSRITVSVKNGTVTLSGIAPTATEKYKAERAAFRVPGVRVVVEEIQVDTYAIPKGNDEEIAQAVAAAIRSTPCVPVNVQARVEDGWVTLRGEVTWESQRKAAVDAVRHQAGVEQIYNLITVKSADQSIGENAIKRWPQKDAKHLFESVGQEAQPSGDHGQPEGT